VVILIYETWKSEDIVQQISQRCTTSYCSKTICPYHMKREMVYELPCCKKLDS
jgi:hypothetical protein